MHTICRHLSNVEHVKTGATMSANGSVAALQQSMEAQRKSRDEVSQKKTTIVNEITRENEKKFKEDAQASPTPMPFSHCSLKP